jgi:hypothetical protein
VITVITATGVETAAARKLLPANIRVMQTGISMVNAREHIEGIAISCGLAGGLRDDLPTGTVLIPHTVRRTDGTRIACDPQMVETLANAARTLGHEPIDAPILTSAALVHGSERQRWAAQGYAGVDMETGLIDADRVACVRVVLDTPRREISPAWETPANVVFRPRAWLDLPFLAREGPRCAQIAASVIAAALRAYAA